MILKTDILIIGSGVAGLTAGIFAVKNKFKKILILNQAPRIELSNTYFAQGGIIYRAKGDSPQKLAKDIFEAGKKIGNRENINILAKEGPKLVKKFLIDELKIPFDRDNFGKLHLTLEGAHSLKRIIHVGDETGKFIEKALVREIKKYPNVKILTNHYAFDLITKKKKGISFVFGAYVIDNFTLKIIPILSKKTILASGGLCWLYLYTTNFEGAKGDGIAMAFRAGAKISNLEFIQFHPTSLYKKEAFLKERVPLISEAVRGEGAILLNEKGERFMQKYSPLGDLAPRDEICQAMYREIMEGKSKKFFLDLKPLIKKGIKIEKRFPFLWRECLKYGIDIKKGLLPVFPCAHYTCGGILVDKYGRTNLENLYAIGEVACSGIHGANRLASTSLLEGIVWGKRCIEDIKKRKDFSLNFKIPEIEKGGSQRPNEKSIFKDFLTLRKILWEKVGIIREKEKLKEALKDLYSLEKKVKSFYQNSKPTPSLFALKNAILTAKLLTQSALNRILNPKKF